MAGRIQFESVRGMREMQTVRGLGVSALTIGGNSYPYLRGSATFAQQMGVGGFSLDTTAVFLVERSLFTTLPKSASIITTEDGKRFKIASVNESADGSHLVLNCADAAQKL